MRSLFDPAEAKMGHQRIGPRRRQSRIGCADNPPTRPLQCGQQVRPRLHSAEFFEMRRQPPYLGTGSPADGDHALLSVCASRWRALIRAILARSSSRTGSNGSICPASTSTLLCRRQASQLSGMLSSTTSIFLMISRVSAPFQPIRPGAVHMTTPPSTHSPFRANTRP
jgi:hypothetical protein